MAGTASKRGPSRKMRRGLRRGSLTPELIVKESLKLLDDKGLDGFSMPKLGRALGADPTAVYRHFASKDDLVLAIADRVAPAMARHHRGQAIAVEPRHPARNSVADLAPHEPRRRRVALPVGYRQQGPGTRNLGRRGTLRAAQPGERCPLRLTQRAQWVLPPA